jgi:hypothetical protein
LFQLILDYLSGVCACGEEVLRALLSSRDLDAGNAMILLRHFLITITISLTIFRNCKGVRSENNQRYSFSSGEI